MSDNSNDNNSSGSSEDDVGGSSPEMVEDAGDEVQVVSNQDFTNDYEWDIDSVRGPHENDEQWNLRRKFLEKNKLKYPKLRMECLSQVFINMEFLGCK